MIVGGTTIQEVAGTTSTSNVELSGNSVFKNFLSFSFNSVFYIDANPLSNSYFALTIHSFL